MGGFSLAKRLLFLIQSVASWDVIMLDLAASIAFGLPANIDLAQIRTPLPRPWPEYGPVSFL